ncbi:MAG: hypothetical protein LBH58_05695 [Tannerellaceae bacterium]|nr:hypothetical protein [Tannerellaceae bacterium]
MVKILVMVDELMIPAGVMVALLNTKTVRLSTQCTSLKRRATGRRTKHAGKIALSRNGAGKKSAECNGVIFLPV